MKLFESVSLLDEASWERLATRMAEEQPRPLPLISSLAYLRHRAGANNVLIEHRYVDRDHRAAFTYFYARQFCQIPQLCERYHFFKSSKPWRPTLGASPPRSPEEEYLGFIIRRPCPNSPIGRSVFPISASIIPGAYAHTRFEIPSHVNETELKALGVPFCQQDSVVMTCAETSIWTAARIMTEHFDHRPVLPSQIASLDTIGFSRHGRVLPSGGLTADQMAHALTTLGFGPVYYVKDSAKDELSRWDALDVAATYLTSSIPVILGIPRHAVTACGVMQRRDRRSIRPSPVLPSHNWVEGLLIQDDARGPFRLMPLDIGACRSFQAAGLHDLLMSTDLHQRTRTGGRWVITRDVDTVLVPLPEKVFLTARDVHKLALEFLRPGGVLHGFKPLILQIANSGNNGARQLYEALSFPKHGGLVYSVRLRRSIDVRSDFHGANEQVRTILRDTPLSRFVWVVEFTTYDNFTHPKKEARELLGELYFDATSHAYSGVSSLIFAHFVGTVYNRPDLLVGSSVTRGPYPILDDRPLLREGIPLWTDKEDPS